MNCEDWREIRSERAHRYNNIEALDSSRKAFAVACESKVRYVMLCVYVCVQLCVYMCTCAYVCARVCAYVYMCACVCAYMCIYVCVCVNDYL